MTQFLKTILPLILRPLLRLLFRIRISGQWPDPLPKRLLIVANHESFLDGILLALFLPVKPVFVLHTWVAQSFFYGLIIKLVDYLAVDPTCPMAIKQVVKLVESGRPVVIFPEGRITVTGALMKVYDGPAFVAAHTDAAILPIRLDGPSLSYFSRMGGGHPRHFLPQLRLTIMPLEHIEIPPANSPHERRRQAGEALRLLMQHMLYASRPLGTLHEALLDAIAVWGRKHRLIEDLRQIEYSYGEFLKMTLALGRLGARLADRGERIGLLLPNVVPTLALMIGLGARQRIPAMLNYTAGLAGIEAACALAQVRTVITSRAFEENAGLQSVTAGLAQNLRVVYLEDLRAQFSWADKIWLLAALCFPRHALPAGSPLDEAVTLFTSGSEGAPKGVVLTHQNLLANLAQIRSVIAFNAQDKFLSALPLFHAFGLTVGALLPLMTGTRLFLYPSPLHYRVIPEVAYDRDCTVLFGTSTFLGQYAKHAHPYDFYRMRYVVAGAERLSAAVRELWFEKFGVRILEGYGATETAPVLTINTPMAHKKGSVGQFLPGIEHWIEPIPDIAEGGLLHVRGLNVMQGYLLAGNEGQLTPTASLRGPGWYCTGDVVTIDEQGFVTIKGRIKRFAKIAGEMISLERVENLAQAVDPDGLHAACCTECTSRGESLILFTTHADMTVDRLQEAARQRGLPPLLVPRDIRPLETMPQLGSGKIDHVTLKRWVEESKPTSTTEQS